MNREETQERVLELVSSPSYMPMRKRGLAKALHISDEDYGEFRDLLDEMVEEQLIGERKRGKFGLLNTPQGRKLQDEHIARKHFPSPVEAEGRRTRQAAPSEASGAPESAEAPRPDRSSRPAPARSEGNLPKGARIGRIDIKRGGMGFLLSEPPGNDVFISAEDLGGALSGDLVAVEMNRRKPEGRNRRNRYGGGSFSRPVGRVIRIMERAHPRIVGTYYSRRGEFAGGVVPDTPGMFDELDVLPQHRGEARDYDKVAVELVEAEETHRSGRRPTARVVKVFGRAGETDADIAAIIENFDVYTEFPESVLNAAQDVPEEIPEEELAQRADYTSPVTFTIDPADAKDHDDAVAIRRESDGRYTLLVHIADVAYYVPDDSVLDIEARKRATSVYLPGKVYPMLPPKISNNVCSLKEGKLRLTKTVAMTFGKNMTMQNFTIERSFIRSAAFLTYDQVREALDENKPELVRTPEIFETLKTMREFAHELRQKRLATGSLELELPEARLLLDDKLEVKGWVKEEHHWAHELIEDMMLAANRAVAEYLVDHELAGLFRIHEEPDPEALKRFSEFVREFGISLRPPVDRLKLKSVLDRVKNQDFAHTVHLALLTSLKQARYAAECQPHFALNFNRYLHFTSPIRRYPDLVVHRALDTRFEPGQKMLPVQGKKRKGVKEGGESYYSTMSQMRPLAAHCSLRERLADKAEEEVRKFKQMQFLRRNMKESHPGVITGVRETGLFVELQDCYVQGLVRVADMSDDYYVYYENQHLLQGRKYRRSFQLGDKVQVRILHMDLGKKQVDLELV